MSRELIAANLREVEERIAAACAACGRPRSSVQLIAVSKTFPAAAVDDAVDAGVTDVGENRVQEMREKIAVVRTRPRWHLIGHLQSNKAREAARAADVIHSIDSLPLAEKVSRACAEAGRTVEVLIQVNVGGEEQKSGCEPSDALELARAVRQLPGLSLVGLMTIPPIAPPEETRAVFRRLRELRDSISASLGDPAIRELSMGMSDDFPLAIAEGATMIRVGRAIFGSRG